MLQFLIVTLVFLFFSKPAFASSVVINEIMIHPSIGNDWIEIYNPTSSQVELNSWSLFDSTSSIKTLSGSINASSFAYFTVSNRLNNAGDSIYLKDNQQNIIDSYNYTSDPGLNISVGRVPDGYNWTTLISSSQNLTNNSTPPDPSPTASPSPDLTPSPTSSPSVSPSSSPVVTFLISEVPLQINSDQSFKAKVEFQKTDTINSKFYLKGAFKKSGSSNYFGQTSVSGNWIKNNETYNKQFVITTGSSGNWDGEILVRPDPDDTGFTGNGSYDFKVGRYESDSSTVSWSNEKTITISQVFQPQPSNTPQTSPTATPKSSPTIIKSLVPTNRSSPKISAATYSSSPLESSKSATVAGIQTDYKNDPSEQSGKFNLLTISGILLIVSTPIVWYLRSKFL